MYSEMVWNTAACGVIYAQADVQKVRDENIHREEECAGESIKISTFP